VPRTRFAPVKTTNDLLVVRSDAYEVDDAARVLPVVDELPFVDLEPERFGKLPDFEARFPAGAPSLRECSRLVVHGDVTFGADVRVRGSVTIEATDGPLRVPDGARLDG
jgi:UTP--glucose-1-phosphate uridylyltransferase